MTLRYYIDRHGRRLLLTMMYDMGFTTKSGIVNIGWVRWQTGIRVERLIDDVRYLSSLMCNDNVTFWATVRVHA